MKQMESLQTKLYPNGNPNGLRLFHSICKQAEAGQFDDTFLEKIIEYHAMYPLSEKFDVFYSQYATAHGTDEIALESLEKAYQNRKANFIVWKLLAQCYASLGLTKQEVFFRGLCSRLYATPLTISIPREQLAAHLDVLSLALGEANYAPIASHYMTLNGDETNQHPSVFAGDRYIPCFPVIEEFPYWAGTYLEQETLDAKGWLLSAVRDQMEFTKYGCADFIFDIMRAQKVQQITLNEANEHCVIPLAGTEPQQKIDFASAQVSDAAWVGQWNYSFFRLDGPVSISSEAPFIIGRPIRLGHDPKRKKVVLRILLDGLCWREMIRSNYCCVPNIMEFFSQGIIFNSHYSVTEYTYTSLPTIETGMYPEHSQLFNLNAYCRLDAEYKTLSEKMSEMGYYCTNLMGSGDGIYNGCTRGYERLVINPYALSTYVGVERAIRQMEALQECDQVLFIHTMDTHPWSTKSFSVPLQTQTRLPLKDRLAGAATEKASVYLPHTPLYEHANRQSIINTDRALGTLFQYLQSHYDDDEYIVQVYSDHGVPIYDEQPYILSENQVGAALMMRGAGIPRHGIVSELTSALDIYPITAHLVGFPMEEWLDGNLPAVFGGKEREYVISESVYPGQTYKMCIRTNTHEFRLESKDPMDEDGTMNLADAQMTISPRIATAGPADETLWKKCLEIVRQHTSSFNNEGHYWPEMRKARPLWFEKKHSCTSSSDHPNAQRPQA